MKKRLIFILAVLTASMGWCQVTVTGKVIYKQENSVAPGVQVVEKGGTKNGTLTNIDGTFSLTVSDLDATLVFSFIGVRTQEFQLKGKNFVFVKLKFDCNKDFFDSQQVHVHAVSGLLNNPVGGQIDFASPWILGGVVKGAYSYQTDLGDNEFQNGHIELAHFISNCDFDMDFRWSHRKISFDNDFHSQSSSLEADLNLSGSKLIAGYTNLDFNRVETTQNSLSGILIGFGQYFNIPLYPTAVAKVFFYNGKVEYQASVEGGYKRFLCFIKFYKLEKFNEISVGIGTGFGYRVKKRNG